jgi:hypothetical protein
MHHPLSEAALARLRDEFADLCLTGSFEQQNYCDIEQDEPELCHLMRLAFIFNARDHGRLRELLDFINLAENWAPKPKS